MGDIEENDFRRRQRLSSAGAIFLYGRAMSRPAIILLEPPECGFRLLRDRPVAGVAIFKRLVLSLCRAGLEEIVVISRGLSSGEIAAAESCLRNDPRFKGNLVWRERETFIRENGLENIKSLAGATGVLLCRGNIVTTPMQLQNLLSATNASASLRHGPLCDGGVSLIPANKLELLAESVEDWRIDGLTEKIQPQDGHNFCLAVNDIASLRRAEKGLLEQYRKHYTQLMDIWFNSLFSIPISSYLVKTPVTPNQLTLFGLVIGALSGWCFAQGDYLRGLAGGALLVFTAIWDCCDGDVARLKFMESDFGEYLDTLCDNIINVFIFIGIAVGVGREHGALASVIPFIILAFGGLSIFALIYFPKGSGKGAFFKGTRMYDVILLLASRNFVYIIFLFSVFDRMDWFLWLAGFGANVFALALLICKLKIPPQMEKKPQGE